MKRQEIESAIFKGTRRALKRAFAWSGKTVWPGDSGAENLIQVTIAEALYKECPARRPAVMLEMTLQGIAGETIKRGGRRVDISLYYPRQDGDAEVCFAVIEVKKYPGPFDEDLNKIAALLAACPSIRFGYLVTYFQKQEHAKGKSKRIHARVAEVGQQITEASKEFRQLDCTNLPHRRIGRIQFDEGDWHAAALLSRFEKR